jgi:micrococcal nuclease
MAGGMGTRSKSIYIILFGSTILTICLIFTLVFVLIPKINAENSYYTVKAVIDGDTIILNTGDRIRYLGIDTPELHHPTIGPECGGQEAKDENVILLSGKRLRMEKDITDKDQYGRLLRYVFTEDGYFVNYEIVRRGWAQVFVIYPDYKYEKMLIDAQLSAVKENLGIWKHCINNQREGINENK